jgi:hypothetical protein
MSQESMPSASRPHIPGYGIPDDPTGTLPWSHVRDRMTAALHYWVCVVSPSGRPHITPVDGLWLDDRLYFGGSPTTRRHQYLAENAAVAIHLESATDVVILHGDAHALHAPDQDLTIRLAAASKAKYGYAPPPEAYAGPGICVFRPQVVFAWQQFPADATCWRLRG